MVRQSLRRLAVRFRAGRAETSQHQRAFGRLIRLLALTREPDDTNSRRYEANRLQGRVPSDPPRELPDEGDATSDVELQTVSPDVWVRPEEADHLTRLAFRSLLRRDPDADTYVGYREGFERGTTFLELVNDILGCEEYQIVNERIDRLLAAPSHAPSPTLDHPIASDMDAALTLLEMRLSEKGCELQLGAVPTGTIDGASARRRVRSLMITLSLVDRL